MSTNHKKRSRGRFWKVLLIIVVVLVAIRIALPYILLDQANKRLKEMPGYYGHIDDLSLSLFRGAYSIHEFYLDKQDTVSRERTPFMAVADVDLSIEMRQLLRGKMVGELDIRRPIVRFTAAAVEPKEVAEDTVALADLLDDFMPLKINRFEIHDGSFQYRDPTSSPEVFLAMEEIQLRAENLTSVENEEVLLPAYVTMDADVYGGRFYLDMDLDPLAESPTFDLACEVRNTDLTLFNPFFKAYGNFDIEKGTFSMFSEVAAKDGKFLGYVKPVIEDLQVLGPRPRDLSLGEHLWQGFLEVATSILENPREEQIATRIPLEGDLEDPDVRTWYAIVDLLRNAFISALTPQLDHDVSIDQVPGGFEEDDRGFFERLFGGQGPDHEERSERRERRRQERGSGK